jgi:hypothetical protein
VRARSLLVLAGVISIGALSVNRLRDLGSVGGDGDTSTPLPVDAEAVNTARRALHGLTVAGRVRGGYRRELFDDGGPGHGGGCTTRELVLLVERVVGAAVGCGVVDGAWVDWYSEGAPLIEDPSEVEVDHLVPLAHAWAAGAWAWPARRRTAFANDVSTPATLTAVSAVANQAKGAAAPEVWQPANRNARCRYAVDWITVKSTWDLTVTRRERETLASMLDRCGEAGR